jgi:NlpC/P60 family
VAAPTSSQFVQLAARYVGTPYVYGGSSPSGFDCSGLIYFALGKLGVNAPRTSQAQYAWTKRVSPQALRPGDLVFLNFPGETGAGHVMIWLGNDKVLQAPQTGQKVQVSKFDPTRPGSNEWGATVVGYGRIPALSYGGQPPASAAPAPASATKKSSGGGGGITGFFGELGSSQFWLRALEVAGGGLILFLGLYLLMRQVGLAGEGTSFPRPLSDDQAAWLHLPAGSQSRPRTRPRKQVQEATEAGQRRQEVKRRAALAQPDDEIPF